MAWWVSWFQGIHNTQPPNVVLEMKWGKKSLADVWGTWSQSDEAPRWVERWENGWVDLCDIHNINQMDWNWVVW